jgi:hypothetical protein
MAASLSQPFEGDFYYCYEYTGGDHTLNLADSTPWRSILMPINAVLMPINAVSALFQRCFNAVSTLFQRRFNAVSTPFQR